MAQMGIATTPPWETRNFTFLGPVFTGDDGSEWYLFRETHSGLLVWERRHLTGAEPPDRPPGAPPSEFTDEQVTAWWIGLFGESS